jgi:hypothetical protein
LERSTFVVHRPWTRLERRVVWRGLIGRLCIAVEPIICGLVFAGITLALLLAPNGTMTKAEAEVVLVPIFGLATLGFAAYAVFVMVAPIAALIQTFSPIYIVDGYVRYRRPDRSSEFESGGYVAVLDADRVQIAEWPLSGAASARDSTRAAHVEFSAYGGIHRIDGRSTGVLPETLAPLGIGINR